MKTILLLLAFVALVSSCKKDKNEIQEVPDEIIRVKMDTVVFANIVKLFPDGKNSVTNMPVLFSDTVQKRIVITKETEVYVTFISESATYKNTLGWYSFLAGRDPATTSELTKNVVFPNISAINEGGLLQQGDRMKLGETTFAPGTVIGFFLVSNGWNNGEIRWNNTTYYTDFRYNATGSQQHVLFREKAGESIILGFEDRDFDLTDKDYNDIILNISDNKDNWKSISFDMEQIPIL